MSGEEAGPGIQVRRRRGYTIVWNDLFVRGMSARAWGLYCYLLTRPDGWEARVSHLRNEFAEGRDALYTALSELVLLGLVVKETYYADGLRRQRYVLDADRVEAPSSPTSAPDPDSQEPGNPGPGDPEPGNPPVVSKEGTTTEGTKNPPAADAAGSDDDATAPAAKSTAALDAVRAEARAIVTAYLEWWKHERGTDRVPESSRSFNALVGAGGRTAASAQYVTAALLLGLTPDQVKHVLAAHGRTGRGVIPPKAWWTEAVAAASAGRPLPTQSQPGRPKGIAERNTYDHTAGHDMPA